MRDEQLRHAQGADSQGRRKDGVPTRRFARRLDCGGDERAAGVIREPAAWPVCRALGTPRDGLDESATDGPPDAA